VHYHYTQWDGQYSIMRRSGNQFISNNHGALPTMRYLLLTYYTKPDGKIDEVMAVATKLKTRDWQTVNVILDFKELKVLKSTVGQVTATKDWDTVVSTYYEHYTNIIERLFQENGHEAPKAEESAPEPEVSED
jgi:hypothetical protein